MRLIILAILLLTGCSASSIHSLYQPDNPDIHLYGPDHVTVDSRWHYLGATRVFVQGKVRDYNMLTPIEQAETLVFSQNSTAGTELLLISRVIKDTDQNEFVYLDGAKKEFQEKIWREATYGVVPEQTGKEMRAYLDLVQSKGVSLASEYSANVLDRLPQSRILLRVIQLTPGTSSTPLPEFGDLYPEDRIESFRFSNRF